MRKVSLLVTACMVVCLACSKKPSHSPARADGNSAREHGQLFLDVHNLQPGAVTYAAVADAHQKDLATQGDFGVNFIKYWVDEVGGKVYCLAEAKDSASLYNTHKKAHGLVPDRVSKVSDGDEATIINSNNLFLDVHHLGKVDSKAVAQAHQKDLEVQKKHGVSFINYWVDEKLGVVMCLAESPNAEAVIDTHKEAHGLVPDEVHKVKQGN